MIKNFNPEEEPEEEIRFLDTHLTTHETVEEKLPPFNYRDLSLYDERDCDYKIIANRLKILNKCHQKYPRMKAYHSKLVSQYASTFDPLRARLRIMPSTRVGIVIGKGPDFFFMKASKQAHNNELTHAIESLEKGLALN